MLAFIAFLTYRYVIRIWLMIGFYKAQGVHLIDGAYIPFLGNLVNMGQLISKASTGEGDKSNVIIQVNRNAVATNGVYDSSKTKAGLMTFASTPVI